MGKKLRRRWLRFPRIIDRFMLREVLGPTVMGFFAYTAILLMRPTFRLMEQIFVQGVAFRDAIQLVGLAFPQMVVMTIPMSFLFGLLIALGRMNSDNEIIAMQAAGISVRRLLVPILGMALLLFSLNGYLTLKVNPESNIKLRAIKTHLITSARTTVRVEPRVFYEEIPNTLLYVEDVDQTTGFWKNVILYDRTTPGEERLTLAKRGRLVAEISDEHGGGTGNGGTTTGPIPADQSGGAPWLLLEETVTHDFLTSKPDTYRVNANQSQLHRLFAEGAGTVTTYRLGMRERTSDELLQLMQGKVPAEEGRDPRQQQQEMLTASVEFHNRLAIPAACIVFSLLALPLGIGSRSGGRGRGFIISIIVVLAYYVMLNHAELLALEGRLPAWAGVWLPNIILASIALLMMRWMGRWLGERRSRNGAWLIQWLRRWRERRLQKQIGRDRQTFTGSIPVHLQRRRYANRFPALLDRYLVRRLLSPLSLVLLSVSSLYIIVDLTDHIDEIAKNRAPLDVVLGYYWNLLPQTIIDVTPLALMISVLILFSVLERQRELTALKAAGISLFRLMVPVLLVATMVAGSLWVLEESVLPGSERETNRLLDRIKGKETTRSYHSADKVWLMSRDGSSLYSFMRFDVRSQTMLRVTMFRFEKDENGDFALRFHLYAHRVRYQDGEWIADAGGWFRQIYANGTDRYEEINKPLAVGIPEGPNYFGQEYRKPEEMSFNELRVYVDELVKSGYRSSRLRVSLHQKLTQPLAAFIMVFLALPFALNRGGQRVTTMQSIALALILGIGYAVVLVAVFGKMGEADYLPPLVGAWMPVVLAVLFAINRMTTLRT